MDKFCTYCRERRPVAEFYRNRARSDGLDTRCKPCSLQRASENREVVNANWRVARERRKEKTFVSLGGRCVCCAESDLRFLTIDHIDNDGQVDAVYGDPLYSLVRKDPSRFRILCWNCNSGRRHGQCPHEEFSVFVPESWSAPATLRLLGF